MGPTDSIRSISRLTKGGIMGLSRTMKFGMGLLVASALCVGSVALPAGAAVKSGAKRVAPDVASDTSAVTEIATLQGKTLTFSDGASCTVSSITCVSNQGATYYLIPTVTYAHMLLPAGAALGIAIGGVGLGEAVNLITENLILILFF